MTDRILKTAIIGLGHLHPVSYMPHFKSAPGVKVVAVCDALESLRTQFARDYGVTAYADWKTLLASEPIDMAYIFLPHCDCAEAAVACAERGLHIVVEKPVAHTSAAARTIAQAASAKKVLFSTPYLWRYHPVTRMMKKIIDQGFLGTIVGCEGRCAAGGLHRYIEGHSPWMLEKAKSGGGPMYNLGVHWIDLYRWLLGSEITTVMGRNVRVNQQYDIEDNSFAICTFASGATLSLDISYTVPDSYPFGRGLYLAIRGTEGCLSFAPAFEGTRQTLFVCSNHPDFGGAPRQTIQFELDTVPGYCGSLGREYVSQMAELVRSGNTAPFIGGTDAVKVLEVVEAIYRSDAGGAAVRL